MKVFIESNCKNCGDFDIMRHTSQEVLMVAPIADTNNEDFSLTTKCTSCGFQNVHLTNKESANNFIELMRL